MTEDTADMQSRFLTAKPRFKCECVVIPFSDGLIIDGMSHPVVLRGPSALEILPRMIPLMNGQMTLEEIARSLAAFPFKRLVSAASILEEYGLVEYISSPAAKEPDSRSPAIACLRRLTRCCHASQSPPEPYQALRNAAVIVLTSAAERRYGDLLVSLLTGSGIDNVQVSTLKEVEEQRVGQTNRKVMLVSLSFDQSALKDSQTAEAASAPSGIPWLRTMLDANHGYADLGPLFIPSESACYRCFFTVHGKPVHNNVAVSADTGGFVSALWLGIVATELVYLCNGTGAHVIGSGFRRYTISNWKHKDLVAPRLPDCPSCRGAHSFPIPQYAPIARSHLLDTSVVFEAYMENRFAVIEAGGSESEEPVDSAGASFQTKFIPTARHWDLNENSSRPAESSQPIANEDGDSRRSLSIGDLSTLLRMTAGMKDRTEPGSRPRRWCATAGNLGSMELYILVNCPLPVPSCLYYYQAGDHSLAQLSREGGDISLNSLLGTRANERYIRQADALIIFTAAYHRVKNKYGPFAYRLVHLDAGVAMSQMKLIASELGIHADAIPLCADAAIEPLLCLDKEAEQVIGAFALSKRGALAMHELSARESRLAPASGSLASCKEPSSYCGLDLSEIMKMMIDEGRGDEIHVPCEPPRDAAPVFAGAAVVLPQPVKADRRPVSSVLRQRQSVRAFAPQPVPLHTLSNLLYESQSEGLRDDDKSTACAPSQSLSSTLPTRTIAGSCNI
jgi:SagB-type dehydrogenase family enzyme